MDGVHVHQSGLATVAEELPVSTLQSVDSPRVNGENEDHTQMLAEVEGKLPPIVVHRATMQIVDGLHRLRAAVLRGDSTIEVLYFDGASADAFVLAVELNRAHGLPLSRADRTAAAVRIIASYPDWSNRRIAAVAGISATTVGTIRRCPTEQNEQLDVRVGADGRTRPNDSAEGRLRAIEVIAHNPNASRREIARAAGVSPTTASDVRARLQRGEEPLPQKQRRLTPSNRSARVPALQSSEAIDILKRDPSLRFTEAGRALLRLLDTCVIESRQWDELVESVPPHQREVVLHLARGCAGSWATFANRLVRQIHELSSRGPQSA